MITWSLCSGVDSKLQQHGCRPQEERPTLFYFNGNLGEAYGGRPEAT
jgi:hypothetical protein